MLLYYSCNRDSCSKSKVEPSESLDDVLDGVLLSESDENSTDVEASAWLLYSDYGGHVEIANQKQAYRIMHYRSYRWTLN